jgi:hypothetical protein
VVAEPNPTADQIDPLLDQLDSDRSAERDAAGRRLEAMLTHVALVSPMLQRVKQRLADARLNRHTRGALEAVLDRARAAWVGSEPASVPLPPLSDEQMGRWLDDVAIKEPADAAGRLKRDTAHRELIDLIVRDDTRERLLALVAKRLAASDDAAAGARLREIADFARPAMGAEVWGHQMADEETGQLADWNHRQHITVQHLLVGVPQMAETALRPTHFDRIDDQTAHCVSGNALSPGDYPVDVAIPNPNPGTELMYYLVNLPTPRRRLAYEYHLRRDEAERLLEISGRTLDHFVKTRRVLDETHAMMLCQLDPGAVSRFAGAYFQAVPDQRMPDAQGKPTGELTLHVTVASMLCVVGTHEAVPALEKLARRKDLPKPNYESPFQMPWIAALAIARRDPWPGVDEWLAGLVGESEPLVVNADPIVDLGATAAGLLLERHQVSPFSFELEPAGNDAFERSRFAGYHFSSDAGRQKVRQWWEKQKATAAAKAVP